MQQLRRIVIGQPVEGHAPTRGKLWDHAEGQESSEVVIVLERPLELLRGRTYAEVVEDHVALGVAELGRLGDLLLGVPDELRVFGVVVGGWGGLFGVGFVVEVGNNLRNESLQSKPVKLNHLLKRLLARRGVRCAAVI